MEETLKEKDYFKSSDICLSTALYCYGYKIDAIDNQSPNKSTFLIHRDDGIDDIIQSYFNHKLRIDPITFFNALKEIKTRIHNSRN